MMHLEVSPQKLPFFPGQRAGRAGGFRSLKNSDLQIAVRGRLRVYTSFPYLARALGLAGENFRSARAQNLKLVLVVVLVLKSEGR